MSVTYITNATVISLIRACIRDLENASDQMNRPVNINDEYFEEGSVDGGETVYYDAFEEQTDTTTEANELDLAFQELDLQGPEPSRQESCENLSDSDESDNSSVFSRTSSLSATSTVDIPAFPGWGGQGAYQRFIGLTQIPPPGWYPKRIWMIALRSAADNWTWRNLNNVLDYTELRDIFPPSFIADLIGPTLCDCGRRTRYYKECHVCKDKICPSCSFCVLKKCAVVGGICAEWSAFQDVMLRNRAISFCGVDECNTTFFPGKVGEICTCDKEATEWEACELSHFCSGCTNIIAEPWLIGKYDNNLCWAHGIQADEGDVRWCRFCLKECTLESLA